MSLCLAILAASYIVWPSVGHAYQPSGADRTYSSSFAYKNVMIPLRDGVSLATDIYVPSNDGVAPAHGHFPVLLLRTPYGKKYWSNRPATPVVASAGTLSPHTANSHGYVVVYQDVRGTFDSEGTFEPMLNEGKDGFDTVEWLRKQSWSDGRVATFGPSYMGGDQMLLAAERPVGLVAAFSQVPATDQFRNEWVYMDGVLALTGAVWTLDMVGGAVSRLPETEQKLLKADYAALGIADPEAM
jgi:putative CocE/NonD family hydrolase